MKVKALYCSSRGISNGNDATYMIPWRWTKRILCDQCQVYIDMQFSHFRSWIWSYWKIESCFSVILSVGIVVIQLPMDIKGRQQKWRLRKSCWNATFQCLRMFKSTDILGYLEVHKYTDHLLSMRCYGFSWFPFVAWTIFSKHLLNTLY